MIRNGLKNRKGGFLCFQVTPGIPEHCLPATQPLEVKGKGGELTDTCLRLLGNTSAPHSDSKYSKNCVFFFFTQLTCPEVSACSFERSTETKAPLNPPCERKQTRRPVTSELSMWNSCDYSELNSADSLIKGLFRLNIQHRRQLTNMLVWSTWHCIKPDEDLD